MISPCARARSVQAAVFLAAFACGLRPMAPTITAGDAAELSCAQSTLGIAHSPGYPLFVLAGKAFSILFPFANPAYRTNLLAVFLGSLCAWVCYRILRVWAVSRPASALGAIFFTFVPAVRRQGLATEVFALNLLIAALLILLVSKLLAENAGRERGARLFILSFFLLGLGMGNQHTIVLFAPPLLLAYSFWAVSLALSPRAAASHLAGAALFFLLGFSIYGFLPVRSLRDPFLDWEDPQSLERFWAVLTRARYGTLQLAQGAPASLSARELAAKSLFFLREVFSQFTWPAGAALSAGAVLALARRRPRRCALALVFFILLSGPFFLMLSNVSLSAAREIVIRFLPLPFLAFFLLGAMGWSGKLAGRAAAVFFIALILFVPSAGSARGDFLLWDLSSNLLRTLPPQSLLLADRADEAEFALAYRLYTRPARKPLSFIDCNAGVTRSHYGSGYYRVWGKPRLALREMREKEWVARSQVPVFYATLDPAMTAVPKVREGILYKAKPLRRLLFPWQRIYALRADAADPGFRGDALLAGYASLLGGDLAEQGLDKEAASAYTLGSLAGSPALAHHAAVLLMQAGAHARAEKLFRRALKGSPEPDDVLCNLGALLEKTGRADEAEFSYRKAVEINPRSSAAHYNLGALYWKRRDWPNVVRELETVLRLDPSHPQARQYLDIALRQFSSSRP